MWHFECSFYYENSPENNKRHKTSTVSAFEKPNRFHKSRSYNATNPQSRPLTIKQRRSYISAVKHL